jgi:HKD family nuclease
MNVSTVTTLDRSLLGAVRGALERASDALLCVAFVQERGLHLLEKELKDLRGRRGRARLLVTTTFQTTTPGALGLAAGLGMEVRFLNPGGGTYHPKLYLGLDGARLRAVIGSANLTGGLATNVEAAVALDGRRDEPSLARAWELGEALWGDERTEAWLPGAAEASEETLDPYLLAAISAAQRSDPVFMTLGPNPRPNRIVQVTPAEVLVETERSRTRRGGAESIPAWMFNLAWEWLRAKGELSNRVLLDELRVHRSSAVCAVLARLPEVEVAPGKRIVLRLRGGERQSREHHMRSTSRRS